jgi:hypothetical protein
MIAVHQRRRRRNQFPQAKRKSSQPTVEHELWVYDGRNCMGRIVISGETDGAFAFNADGILLGRFACEKAASIAIGAAYKRISAMERVS